MLDHSSVYDVEVQPGTAATEIVGRRSATGAVMWRLIGPRNTYERIAVDGSGGSIYSVLEIPSAGAGPGSTVVAAVSQATGQLRWAQTVMNSQAQAAVISYAAGRIFIGTLDAGTFAYDTNGHQLWRQPLAFGPGTYSGGRYYGGLAVVDPATGALLFRFDTRDVDEPGPPTVAGNYVIFAGMNGLTNDANNGSMAWYPAAGCGQAWCAAVKAVELRDRQYFPPVVANGNVYVARDAGLQTYASPTGVARWLDKGGNLALLVRHVAGSYVWSIDDGGYLRGYPIAGCGHPKCSPAVSLHGANAVTAFLPAAHSVLFWGFAGLYSAAD